MNPRASLALAALTGAVLVPLAAVTSSQAAAPTALPVPAGAEPDVQFTTPLFLAGGGAEPGVRAAREPGFAAYVSAPTGLGSNFWSIAEKTQADGSHLLTPSAPQQPDLGTGGGDAEISTATAPAGSNACPTIAYSGLHNIDALDNFTTSYSNDCGKTFALPNAFATQNTLTDRQWQAFDGKKTNFLIYHKVDTGQIVVNRSEDGGATYLTLGTAAGATGVVDATRAFTLPNVKIGNIVVDRASREELGTYPLSGDAIHPMYAIFTGGRDAAEVAQATANNQVTPVTQEYDGMSTVYVGRSIDGGLTWTDSKVFSTPTGSTRELDLIFPVIAVDAKDNLYAAWADGSTLEYAFSTDKGATWSKSFRINAGEPGQSNPNGTGAIFPWIVAGANGMIDVVWYHAEGGDTRGYRKIGNSNATLGPVTTWSVAFAQLSGAASKDAGGTPTPTITAYDTHVGPRNHVGSVCNNGLGCDIDSLTGGSGDRSLLDYFQVDVDPQGRANIVYADNASSGGTFTTYVRQNGGRSLLTGDPVPYVRTVLPTVVCTPDAAFTDPVGDATQAGVADTGVSQANAPQLDITGGNITYDAAKKVLTFHLKIAKLEADPATGAAPGSIGEVVEYSFGFGGQSYLMNGTRDSTATTFNLQQPRSTNLTSLTGAFDAVKSEVRFELPTDTLLKLKKGPEITAATAIDGLVANTRRNARNLVPIADDAVGLCAYRLGTSSQQLGGVITPANTVVSKTTTKTVAKGRSGSAVKAAGGSLAATGLPVALPALGCALLAGALVLRRRRAS